jgi:HK97 gp10 family phage protein
MAKFTVSIYGVDQLIKRFEAAPQKMYNESKAIIDEAVNEMATKAYHKASNLPIINPNSKYERTGNLARSIRQSKFTPGQGASISAGNGSVRYAAFVEFGTGQGYGIPAYPNLNMSSLEDYAFKFKRGNKLARMPYRPYMFDSYSEVFSGMLKKMKSIKI